MQEIIRQLQKEMKAVQKEIDNLEEPIYLKQVKVDDSELSDAIRCIYVGGSFNKNKYDALLLKEQQKNSPLAQLLPLWKKRSQLYTAFDTFSNAINGIEAYLQFREEQEQDRFLQLGQE